MESNDREILGKVGRAVVGGLLLGGVVGGPGGAVAGGLIGGAVAAAALCPKEQEEQQSQQPTHREPRESAINRSSPPVETSFDQENAKQSLVLVISASQAEFLKSLKGKKHIDVSEGETLYQITRYLWLGSETKLSQTIPDINEDSVAGAESEYNIYLVEIKLKQDQDYEGFKPNVNQLDRHDAFRKLADLAVDVKVSGRLGIEAYGNLGVYNR